MIARTLIHNDILSLYINMAFVLNAISCQAVAGVIHARWLVKKEIKIINLSTFFKGILVVIGFLIFSIKSYFASSFIQSLIYILIGLVIGYYCMLFEKFCIRNYLRSLLLQNRKIAIENNLGSLMSHAVLEVSDLKLSSKKINTLKREVGLKRSSHNLVLSKEVYQFNLLSLICSALFEELIFRGFLLSLSFQFNSVILSIISVLCVTISFSFLHFNFGTVHILLKLLFSFCMLSCVLLTGNLLTSCAAHICFNILAWRYLKNKNIINTHHTPSQIAVLG